MPAHYKRIQKVIGVKQNAEGVEVHLIVWEGLAYNEATWEDLGNQRWKTETETVDDDAGPTAGAAKKKAEQEEEEESSGEESSGEEESGEEDEPAAAAAAAAAPADGRSSPASSQAVLQLLVVYGPFLTDALWLQPLDEGTQQQADLSQLERFQKRNAGAYAVTKSKKPARGKALKEAIAPDDVLARSSKCGKVLKDYQLEGVNWSLYNWAKKKNCMIGDEMGLGKTAQTIAIMHYLHTVKDQAGPFLIIAPKSTIPHWVREIEDWTDMVPIEYTGDKEARTMMREHEFYADRKAKKKFAKFNVIVTTYDVMQIDYEHLKLPWRFVCADEAHRLKDKNGKTRGFINDLEKDFLLLLTGTPVQNNVGELFTLLNLMDGVEFPDRDRFGFEAQYGEMDTAESVEGLSAVLRARMIRRLKDDVFKDGEVGAKEETIIWVELTAKQKEMYRGLLDQKRGALTGKGDRYQKMGSMVNLGMELRKLCNHPLLIEGAEENIRADMPSSGQSVEQEIYVRNCGKMVLLDILLPKLRAEGHKVLIFSQMTRVLDILGDYMDLRGYPCERLDGSVHGDERQKAIDRFSDKEAEANASFIFLLSTRAGGVGINLTAADTCIIYDSDWNPQNDLQAMARCHRIGQEKQVSNPHLILTLSS